MPTVFSHPAPAIALAVACGSRIISPRLAVAAVAASILPDLDVAGLHLGVRYGDVLGHRGLSHSLVFALGVGLLGSWLAPLLRSRRVTAFLVLFLAVASHILLDAATSGGLGVAVFWPFDETRRFLPWRPIRVSPFSPKAFLTSRGLAVIVSELRWVWLPCLAFGLVGGLVLRRTIFRSRNSPPVSRSRR